MSALTRAIQGLILFATLFGVAFLYEVHPVLRSFVFYSVAFGWVLFVVDSALTFVRPKASYYLGLVLSVVAFGITWSQPAHFQLMANGNVPATITIFVGSAVELLIIASVLFYAFSARKSAPWAMSAKPEG